MRKSLSLSSTTFPLSVSSTRKVSEAEGEEASGEGAL